MTANDSLPQIGPRPGQDIRAQKIRTEWGRAIEDQRRLVGLSRADLASELEVTVQAVENWENGRRAPRTHLQVAIARALHVSHSLLFKVES